MNGSPRRIRRLYIADYLLTPDKRVDHGGVLCENDRILAVGNVSAFTRDPDIEIYEFPNAYITPGFIDTHIHGAGGFDCSSARTSPRNISNMGKILAERGMTGFVPTVVADRSEIMLENLSLLADLIDSEPEGAVPLGINIEGPFINSRKRGSQQEYAIKDVDLGFAAELFSAGKGKIRLMTFAPELPGATRLVEFLSENNITASMGHTEANESQTLRAIAAGARRCTHLFNGMPPLHQRNMSVTSIALTDSRVTVELIIDGRHIHPRMVDLACRCKAADQLVGISDCTMGAGMPNGEYRIGPSPIKVENGVSQTFQNVLAGTTTMLDTGWHSLMSCGHLQETQAAAAVTFNAARSIGLFDRGVLLPMKRADVAVFEQHTNRPLMTVCNGRIVYTGKNNE